MRNHGYPERGWFDPRLERRPSPVDGHGVFATAPIAAGERIQVVGGLVVTGAERLRLRERLQPGVAYNEGQLDDDLWVLNPVDEGLNYFFNHSCDPNSTGEVTRRDIATGEEVTMDYAIEMDGDYELAPCRCGPLCAAAGSPGGIGGGRSCRSGTATSSCPSCGGG